MGEDGLNLEANNLENVVQGLTKPFNMFQDAILPGLSVLLFLVIVGFSIRWANKRKSDDVSWPSLSKWPIALRASLWPLLFGYALTHAFAAGSVYYHSKIANPSTLSYFAELGVGRLLSLSHAHLFAHATMYFILAVLVQATRSSSIMRIGAPLVALWAGVFDVFSWWGLKMISAQFEILSALCGISFSLAFLLMAFAILKESLQKHKEE